MSISTTQSIRPVSTSRGSSMNLDQSPLQLLEDLKMYEPELSYSDESHCWICILRKLGDGIGTGLNPGQAIREAVRKMVLELECE